MQTFQNIVIDGSVTYRQAPTGFARFRNNSATFAHGYEQRIMALLTTIAHHLTGRILLGELALAGRNRRLTIVPSTVANNAAGGADVRPQTTALGQPLGQDAALALAQRAGLPNHQLSSTTGRSVVHTADNPLTAATETAGQAALGSGEGTDGVVFFDPARLTRHFVGGAPDEVLFHELVHAKHAMEGRIQSSPLGNHYTNHEEFGAVLATDIYLSNKGSLLARNTHRLPQNLEIRGVLGALGATQHTTLGTNPFAGMADGAGGDIPPGSPAFARSNQAAILVFFAQDGRFAGRLAREARAVPYNPLRDFLAATPWVAA